MSPRNMDDEPKAIPDDEPCLRCGLDPQRYTCDDCGVSAMLVNCGHQAQPRPIAAAGCWTYCDTCADLRVEAGESLG